MKSQLQISNYKPLDSSGEVASNTRTRTIQLKIARSWGKIEILKCFENDSQKLISVPGSNKSVPG